MFEGVDARQACSRDYLSEMISGTRDLKGYDRKRKSFPHFSGGNPGRLKHGCPTGDFELRKFWVWVWVKMPSPFLCPNFQLMLAQFHYKKKAVPRF